MKTVIADKRWATKYPEVGTGPVSTEPNISPELYAIEREQVFRRCWLNIGRVDRLPAPGDYFVEDIEACNVSVLVTRGRDGVIRAFHNVCTHRSNHLVWDKEGHANTFVCGFHCWVFDNEGKLRNITDESNFHDLDKGKLGLKPIALEEWHGFLFVNLDPEPQWTLREYLGGIVDEMEGGDFGPFERIYQYRVEERANWKTALSAQNELYHVPFQHRATIPEFAVKKDGRYIRLQDVRFHGKHSIYSSEAPVERERMPIDEVAYGRTRDEHRLPLIGDFDFYTIFPNFAILIVRGAEADSYLTYNFWPQAVDETRWEIGMYFVPPQNAGESLALEYAKCQVRDILHEDIIAHEEVQSGLASRANPHFHFQDEEIQIRHFHEVWEDTCGVSL